MMVYIVVTTEEDVEEYPDFGIVYVFDSEEQAEAMADVVSGFVVGREIKGVSPFPSDANIYSVSCYNENWDIKQSWAWSKCGKAETRYHEHGEAYGFYTHCIATNEEHALEIGHERLAFMIATYGEHVNSLYDFGKQGEG